MSTVCRFITAAFQLSSLWGQEMPVSISFPHEKFNFSKIFQILKTRNFIQKEVNSKIVWVLSKVLLSACLFKLNSDRIHSIHFLFYILLVVKLFLLNCFVELISIRR